MLLTVSTSRTKLRIVIASASCGAFVLLSLGALFACRYQKLRRLKHKHDLFVDVPGNFMFSLASGSISS